MTQNDNRTNDHQAVIDRAVQMFWVWAENNPEEHDPTQTIDDLAAACSTDDSTLIEIQARLWEEWGVIDGERRLTNDFEDDLD